MAMAERRSNIRLTKDTPYLDHTGELTGVFFGDFGENWPRYNGTYRTLWVVGIFHDGRRWLIYSTYIKPHTITYCGHCHATKMFHEMCPNIFIREHWFENAIWKIVSRTLWFAVIAPGRWLSKTHIINTTKWYMVVIAAIKSECFQWHKHNVSLQSTKTIGNKFFILWIRFRNPLISVRSYQMSTRSDMICHIVLHSIN